mgnify:CR=1 FL=1
MCSKCCAATRHNIQCTACLEYFCASCTRLDAADNQCQLAAAHSFSKNTGEIRFASIQQASSYDGRGSYLTGFISGPEHIISGKLGLLRTPSNLFIDDERVGRDLSRSEMSETATEGETEGEGGRVGNDSAVEKKEKKKKKKKKKRKKLEKGKKFARSTVKSIRNHRRKSAESIPFFSPVIHLSPRRDMHSPTHLELFSTEARSDYFEHSQLVKKILPLNF